MWSRLFLVFLVLILAMPVAAQNEPIPACSADDLAMIEQFVNDDFLPLWNDVSEQTQAAADVEAFKVAVDAISDLHVQWHTELKTTLPDCALSIALQNSVDVALSESLLALWNIQWFIAASFSPELRDVINVEDATVFGDRAQFHGDTGTRAIDLFFDRDEETSLLSLKPLERE